MFIEVTRPDGSTVSVATAWIYMIRPSDPPREQGNSVLVMGGRDQQCMETVAEIKALVYLAKAEA